MARSQRFHKSNSLNVSQNKLMQSMKVDKTAFMQKKKEKKINVVAKIFEAVIMSLILISSITLVIDGPLSNPDDDVIVFVGYLDNCFTVLFTIEASIKIIALGFLFTNQAVIKKGQTAYIRNPWNIIDCVVVVASLIDFVVTVQTKTGPVTGPAPIAAAQGAAGGSDLSDSLSSLKALRALRALRPLRMISRDPGMKLIVNALLQSIPSMGNVTIVCMLFVLIFAIMGVDFFKGLFKYCSISDNPKITDKPTCLANGGEWMHVNENFDNVLNGMTTLIEMMTTEGWIDVMNNGIDSVDPINGIEQQPIQDNKQGLTLFFVFYMIVGSQFILNLFVGVVMDNFNKLKEQSEMGSVFVTEEQRAWIDANKLGLKIQLQKKREAPEGWRRYMFNIQDNAVFDGLITFFIALNTLIMAIKYDGIDPALEKFFEDMNIFFSVVFNIEMFIKLLGLGCGYFDQAWNIFDMIVVIATDIGFILTAANVGASFSTAATVIRAFRIMRIIRLIRSQESIKIILDTLMIILP